MATISCDEYREDLYCPAGIFNGRSGIFLLVITLLLVSALLWIFLKERRIQKL